MALFMILIFLALDGSIPVDAPQTKVKLRGKEAFIAIAVIDSICIILALILLFYVVSHRKHRYVG